MKLILTLFVLLLIVFSGMVVLVHHDTAERANVAYKKLAPVTATFSRFRGNKDHLLSVYWRLHFSRKTERMGKHRLLVTAALSPRYSCDEVAWRIRCRGRGLPHRVFYSKGIVDRLGSPPSRLYDNQEGALNS